MAERSDIVEQRRRAAEILRERRDDLIDRWMGKIRLLTREKGPGGLLTEQVLRDDAIELVEMLLSRLEGRGEESGMAAFYKLIFQGRQHEMRLADVAYVLLELKSVSKQVIFEAVPDELDAFRVSRLTDDAIEAVLRKSADLYELTSEADHLTAQERLHEIFAAWDIEEALADAEAPSQVAAVMAAKLRGIWDLAGCRIRFDFGGEDVRELADSPELPVPMVHEQRQFLTESEAQSGTLLDVMDSALRRRECHVCGDVRSDVRIINGAALAEAGAMSFACVPLLSRDRAAGALLLYGHRPNTFRTTDTRRLRDFAGVLSLALDRTGRLERSRKAISEAEVIARIGRSLLELPTRDALLEGVMEALRSFRDYFDVALFRVDEEAGRCVLVAEAGREHRYRPEESSQPLAQGIIGLCARTGQTIRASDLETARRGQVAFREEYRARSELTVPVRKGDRVLGVIHVLSEREEDFPESEIAALEHVAPHIGVALLNARMIAQRKHDRYEIDQAHRQLANIIRCTAVGITSTDREGVYTHWSPSCREMLGHTEEEVVGRMSPADFADEPYDLPRSLRECLRLGRAVGERTLLRKDGTRIIVRETRVPLSDEDGSHVGFTSFLVDVTEQKRSEESLRRERDTLDLVVGAMGAGLALYDRALRLQWANPTMMLWFNMGPDAVGKECHDVCICGYCRSDTCPIEQALGAGRPETRIHEMVDPDGSWRCYQQVFTPVSRGETRMVVLTLDITDQRRQTEQMRLINKLAEKVETSLELAKVLHLVLTCVTAGHAIGLNRAFVFLMDDEGEALAGRMAVGPVSSADAHRIWGDLDTRDQSIESLLDSTTPSASDRKLTALVRSLSIPLSDGSDTLVSTLNSRTTAHVGDAASDPHLDRRLAAALELEEFVCVPLAAQDHPLGVMLADNKYSRVPISQEQVELLEVFSRQASLAIANARAYQRIQDQLHELETARDKLIEAERMASVGRMASHLAHEIRNPLTAIGGFAASIARRHKGDERTHRNAMIIYEEVRRLERTLVNVLDYTRPLRPNRTPVPFNDLVRETLHQFKGQMDQSRVSLRTSLDERIGEVLADGEMVKQVIINLIKNALESMTGEQEQRLTVRTALKDGSVELTVADTGCGVRPESMGELFSPFFTTKIGGVGLGLSVSRQIVAQHGGRIEVESRPGAGSQFVVTFGTGEAQEPPEPEGAQSATGP